MLESILGIINKILEHFIPKQNVTRLKQELRDCEVKLFELMHTECTEKRARKVEKLKRRINEIHAILGDHAVD